MWIPRVLEAELEKLAASFSVIVLTGPRQTGKTALVERVFDDYRYVSLDFAQNAESAESNPGRFLAENPPPLIIDEIQYAPSLLRHIKTRVDADRGEKGLYVITGSQSFALMEQVSESLAGRAAIVPFQSLSFGEISACRSANIRDSETEFMWRGGFPELWSDPTNPIPRERWYQSYVTTYLERDVRNLLNVGNLRDFERFLRVAATRTGQLLNMSEIGRDVGISPTTAREWFSVLVASNLVVLLEPYYRSLGKRITKSPKLYFADTGLVSFLCGYGSPNAMEASPRIGAMWENHVIEQWSRWRDWQRPEASLWYWQDKQKNEVDLIVDVDGILFPIEIKWKQNPGKKDVRGMHKFIEMYGREAGGTNYVACTTSSTYAIESGIEAINAWDVWTLQ